jgi:hypothetical protein
MNSADYLSIAADELRKVEVNTCSVAELRTSNELAAPRGNGARGETLALSTSSRAAQKLKLSPAASILRGLLQNAKGRRNVSQVENKLGSDNQAHRRPSSANRRDACRDHEIG